jgi:hypothetical protein
MSLPWLNETKRFPSEWTYIRLLPGEKRPAPQGGTWLTGTADDAAAWVEAGYNVGLVAGESGLVVVDVDCAEGAVLDPETTRTTLGLPQCPTIQTGSGGVAFILQDGEGEITPPVELPTGVRRVDIRRGQMYQVLPPSVHPSGNSYWWVVPPDGIEMPPVPSSWLRGIPLNDHKGGDFDPEPTPQEVEAVLAEARRLLRGEDLDLLDGVWPEERVEGIDRSEEAYRLAALLWEAGMNDPRRLACAVFGSAVHRAKFAGRKGGWVDACRLAEAQARRAGRVFDNVRRRPKDEPKGEVYLPFPQDSAVGVCAEIADLYARHFEAPYSFWYFAALTCLGAAISGSVRLASALDVQPRLYTVLIGPTAFPRKSTAMRYIVKFFQEALEDRMPHVVNGLGSGEGLAKELSELEGTRRCLIVLDELRLFVQKATIKGASLLTMLNSLHSLNNYANATRGGRIKLEGTHISMLAACTEDTYATMWGPEFLAIGFLNRLWLVPDRPERVISLPPELPPDAEEALQRRLRDLVRDIHFKTAPGAFGEKTINLHLTDEAKRRWHAWYVARPTDANAARLDDYGFRLMLLQEIARGNLETVEPDTIERVVKLLEWQHRVRQLYQPVDADNRMAAMEERIRRIVRDRGSITRRELRRAVNASRVGNWVFEKALENLKRAEELKERGMGKRTEIIWCGEDG